MRTMLAGSKNSSPNKKLTCQKDNERENAALSFLDWKINQRTKNLHQDSKKKEEGMQVIIVFITKPCDLTTENKVLVNKDLRYF